MVAKRSEEQVAKAWSELRGAIDRWQREALDGNDRAVIMEINSTLAQLGRDYKDVYATNLADFKFAMVPLRGIGAAGADTARSMTAAVEDEASAIQQKARSKKGDNQAMRQMGVHGVPDPAVLAALQMTKGRDSMPKRNQLNVWRILTKDPKYAGKIRENELRGVVEIEWDGAWVPMTDGIEGAIANDITDRYLIDNPGEMVHKQAIVVAGDFRHNPVCAWLSDLRWDGKRRVHRLLADYFDAKIAPGMEALAEGISVCFMVGAVARAFRPGCKLDNVLVLQGDEGSFKSTAFATLFRESPERSPSHWWFRSGDLPKDFQGRDMKIQLRGPWCCEIQEIDRWTMSKDLATIRSFITTEYDSFRAMWGKNAEDIPRRFIFVGTCNSEDPLDDSENRRFWVFRVGRCRTLKIAEDRAQLWAEAVKLFNDGSIWHLNEEQKADMNKHIGKFRARDPWSDRIADWAGSIDRQGEEFSLFEALEVVGVKGQQADMASSRRMSKVLRDLGFSPIRSVDPHRSRRWSRSTSDKPKSPDPLC